MIVYECDKCGKQSKDSKNPYAHGWYNICSKERKDREIFGGGHDWLICPACMIQLINFIGKG